MLISPSGKIIDLSTDRAKYHALRDPGITSESAHRALYAVVDVVNRHKNIDDMPCRGWTEFDYHYSGYTIASIRLSENWSDEDKAAIFQWVQLPNQIRVIETARRRLTDNQNFFSIKEHSSPRHLYSLLKKRLCALSLQRTTAKQWQATISNFKKNGVREEEIQWSGLLHYFKTLPSDFVISKQAVIDRLSFENIRIELNTEREWGVTGGLNFNEVVKRMPHQAVYRAALKLDDSCSCILRYQDSCYNYRVGVVKTSHFAHKMALNRFWFALDPYGRAITNTRSKNTNTSLFFTSSASAKHAADNHAREITGIRGGVKTYTRYDHLTLFGGIDYREWTISLPDFQRTFFGAHFFDHNVIAHVRTTTRSDKNGQLLLFIEEIQSDWHQSGKRYGYDTSYWGTVANAPFKKEWAALAAKLMLIQASQNGFAGIAWPNGDIQEMRYKRNLHAIKHHYDNEIPKALNQLGKTHHSRVEKTIIETRDPWLNVEKSENKWRVADGHGKFETRAKYNSRNEAMAVIMRHCRNIELVVPVFYISDHMRQQIDEEGLPLFGQTIE